VNPAQHKRPSTGANPAWVPPPSGEAPSAEWLAWIDNLALPRWCGVRSIRSEDGLYECVLEHSPIGLNLNRAVNGAITVAIADHCMGAVAARELFPERLAVTAALNAQFHRPALLPLTFRATLTSAGQTLMFIQVEVFDGRGKLCLRSSGTMAVRSATDVRAVS
jgi:uncharacterized protein (TIGR00369 family)